MELNYRAGVIGLGRVGAEFPDNHCKAYNDCERTELVWCCDSEYRKIRRVPFDFHWECMDYQAAKNLKPDIISVCTPPETHCKIVCDIAPYVKAIYCEKPIATTLKDADKMIEACKKHNTILQINHQRRFTRPKFRFSRGWLNTGTHAFDLLRQLFGEFTFVHPTCVGFENVTVDIEYVDTEEHIFNLDCTHNGEPMILKGVEHIVACLDNPAVKRLSTGEDGRKALEAVLIASK